MQGLLPDDIPQPVADDIHASWRDGMQHSVLMVVGYSSVIPWGSSSVGYSDTSHFLHKACARLGRKKEYIFLSLL